MHLRLRNRDVVFLFISYATFLNKIRCPTPRRHIQLSFFGLGIIPRHLHSIRPLEWPHSWQATSTLRMYAHRKGESSVLSEVEGLVNHHERKSKKTSWLNDIEWVCQQKFCGGDSFHPHKTKTAHGERSSGIFIPCAEYRQDSFWYLQCHRP